MKKAAFSFNNESLSRDVAIAERADSSLYPPFRSPHPELAYKAT
jgi:hypothetical protein